MTASLETLTFKQAALRYPAFTESALRWLRFNGCENGFDSCVIKLGRRVLLDVSAFERWIESHRDGQAAA